LVAYGADLQVIEELHVAREVFSQNWEDLGWVSGDQQGSGLTNVWNRQNEGLPIVCIVGLPGGDLQEGRH